MPQAIGFVKTASMLLVVSSLIGALIGITTHFVPAIADPKGSLFLWMGVALTVLHVLEVIGNLGFWISGASGRGWLARIGLSITVLGFLVLTAAEATIRFSWEQGNNLFSLAVPFAGLGYILAGIAVIRTRQWTGWHKLTPLINGLYVPFLLLPAFAMTGGPIYLAIAGWSLCRLALGVALAQSNQSPRPPQRQ